ncbi:MAG: DUF2811 domain-containing protein [Cyanobacteria bacterium P01_D01_bin.36]
MTISTNVEILEPLHKAAQQFLEDHPDWNQDRIVQAALSLFLMQNGVNEAQVNSVYLDSLFRYKPFL